MKNEELSMAGGEGRGRSLFVSLDGLDGSGKSTQCKMLAEWLRMKGCLVTECADPGGTAVGAVIRDLLLGHRAVGARAPSEGEMSLHCEALLFMASRAQLVAEVIRPALDAGQAVVSDRFLLANVVYQGHAGGLDPEQLWTIGRLATNELEPNLTIVLDLPVELALARRGRPADRVESRNAEYHSKVRSGFLAEAKRASGLNPEAPRIKIVDASQPVAVVHERICQEVAHVMAARART